MDTAIFTALESYEVGFHLLPLPKAAQKVEQGPQQQNTPSTGCENGTPFGCLSDRKGRGAIGSPGLFLFMGIDPARLAVPQDGAKKIPTPNSFESHCINNSMPTSVERSARTIGDIAILCLFFLSEPVAFRRVYGLES